ncbi:MAG: hypothetical protein NC247_01940 [Ruminococcus flavefaciens]|nr:hypothetical protein [Ruminococcus flavefaciens]
MSDFTKYTNYKENAGVSGVVFGAHSAVLEVEMNEMQEISKGMFRDFVKAAIGDGITNKKAITYADGTLKIAAGCGVVVDGIMINCTGLSLAMTSGTAYLQVWEETVAFNAELKVEGNQQSTQTVPNWAKDNRSDVETTRRKVVKYTLATSKKSGAHNLAIASVSSGKMTKLAVEVNLNNLTAEVADLKGFVGLTDPDIYGVEVDWKNNKFTRLNASIGKTGGADHDGIAPWDRRRCNVTDAGEVVAYYGDAAYTETGKLTQAVTIGSKTWQVGTRVQVMVEQNQFFYRMVPLEMEPITGGLGFKVRKARYYISATPKAGFKLFPAFDRNGAEKKKIYEGAFKGSIYTISNNVYVSDDSVNIGSTPESTQNKLSSVANVKPASGLTNALTRKVVRKMADNLGAGWQQADFLTSTMLQWLFLVEYATMDAQTVIGRGRCDITDDGATSMTVNTGGTSTIGNGTGRATGVNGEVSVSYRGKEDPFGNIWEFVDGINIEAKGKNVVYWADHGFADDTAASPYQPMGFTITKNNGYISAFGWSEDCDFAFLAAETAGDSAKPVGDYTWVNPDYNGWLIALLGGYWDGGSRCGLGCWTLNDASSDRSRNVGSRLVYIPQS